MKGIVKENHPIIQKKIKDSLRLSVNEGGSSSVSSGLGLSYLSPFALFMNATSSQIGILYAIINLLPSIVQLKSATLIEKFSRKKLVMTSVVSRIILWIPIILTGLLFYFGVPYVVWILIFLVSLFYTFAAIGYPAWFSWMGSMVSEEERGKYFAKRNRIVGFFSILTMILGGIILDVVRSVGVYHGNVIGFTLVGFGFLFSTSAIAKIVSFNFLVKQYEPRLKIKKKDYFSLKQFLSDCKETPFGRFVLFRGFLSFSVAIASPFWAVYMLRDLGFSYVWYMIITVSSVFFQLIFLPLIGRFSDNFGNVRLMKICSWLFFLTPFAWVISAFIPSLIGVKIYLFLVPSIIAGFAGAGYNLAVNNYVYDSVASSKVSFGASYMNFFVGVGIFFGASFGSLLAWLNVSFMNPLLFIFMISGAMRFLVALIGTRFLREVRHVKKFYSNYLIRELVPVQGFVREVHNMGNTVRRVGHYI